MAESAAKQQGFLGVESAREELGITVSYWDSLDAIAAWKRDSAHLIAQKLGRERWYEAYKTRNRQVETLHRAPNAMISGRHRQLFVNS